MRLHSHRCVSSFIRREQPEKGVGSSAFREWRRPGCRGSGEHWRGGGVAWRGVPPPRRLGRSPHGHLLPTHSQRRQESRRLPYVPVSSKAVNNTCFLGPVWQTVLWDVSQR